MIYKLVGSAFYVFEYSFDSVPISVRFIVKSEVVPVDRGLEPRRAIDERHGVGDVVILAEFAEKPLSEAKRLGRMNPDVKKFAGFGI